MGSFREQAVLDRSPALRDAPCTRVVVQRVEGDTVGSLGRAGSTGSAGRAHDESGGGSGSGSGLGAEEERPVDGKAEHREENPDISAVGACAATSNWPVAPAAFPTSAAGCATPAAHVTTIAGDGFSLSSACDELPASPSANGCVYGSVTDSQSSSGFNLMHADSRIPEASMGQGNKFFWRMERQEASIERHLWNRLPPFRLKLKNI